MHRIRKRTEITVETEEILVRHAPQITKCWCAECGAEVSVATPEVASVIANLPAATITQGIASGQVHATQAADGRRSVCLSSLFRWTAPEKRGDAQT